ncbi:MAG: xanthine dehydrogenase small subunit [Deltaproteobacteria bacterium]|nr:xanthine dehydrogenase small subunit [Deltaproteobacteria bacterium]
MYGLEFTLNGARTSPEGFGPTTTLLQYLRATGRTGTKEGCAEGDCGACTVAILDPDAPKGPTWRAINSCLVLLPTIHGRQVVTIEGLSEPNGPVHPAPAALVERLGSQCGYCTPGFVMSLFEACYRTDLDRPERLDDQLAGNLCRCTGYRPIREAAQAVAGLRPSDRFRAALEKAEAQRRSWSGEQGGQRFFLPTRLEELWAIQAQFPGIRLVAGATDLGLEITKRFAEPPLLCGLEGLSELRGCRAQAGHHHLGAMTLLADLEDYAELHLPPLHRMLRFFAARPIKNRGTLGGNLVTASPIGDLAPVLLALGAEVVLTGRAGSRRLPLSDFFLGYRKTALGPGELLSEVIVPALEPGIRAAAYKVSKRQELDISTVSASFWLRLDPTGRVEDLRLAYGGMAATPCRAPRTEAALRGQPYTEENVRRAAAELERDFQPLSDHRGSAWYRRVVAQNLLLGFWLETEQQPLPQLPTRPIGTVTPPEARR